MTDLVTQLHDRIREAIVNGDDVERVFDFLPAPPDVSDRVDVFASHEKAAPMPSITIHNHPPGVEVGPTFIEPPKVDIQNIVEPTPITVEGPTVENLVATPEVFVSAPTVNVSQPDVNVAAPTVNVENRTEKADTPDLVYVVNMPEPSKVKVDRGPDGRVTGAHQE